MLAGSLQLKSSRIFSALCWSVMTLLLASAAGAQELPTLTSASAIRALSPEEAERQYPVDLRATVTLIDPDRTLFLQDSMGGTFVRLQKGLALDLTSGTEVHVRGNTYPGLYLPGIAPITIEPTGPGTLPTPVRVNFDELASGHRNYEWVSVSGIVRAVDAGDERTVLELSSGNGRLELHLPGTVNADHLIDAVIDATGLAAGFINDKRQLVAPHLRLRGMADIVVRTPAPADPFALPTVPAGQLLRFSPQQRPGHRVKVTGIVTLHVPGTAVFVRDGEQGLQIGTREPIELTPGDVVEAVGFPAIGRFSAMLQDSTLRVLQHVNAPAPVSTVSSELLKGTHDSDLVRVEAQLLRVLPGQTENVLLMQAGSSFFQARLPSSGEPGPTLRPGSVLALTGVCTIIETDRQPRGFRSTPRTYELLLRNGTDIALIRQSSWWTTRNLAYLAAALFALACIAAIWAAMLRYQVRRQTLLLSRKVQQEAIMEERQRIAREFHDTLEQELVGLTLRLDALATRIADEKPRELLDGIRRLVHKLQVEARMLVWDLRERAALRTDLAGSIQEATAAVSRDRSIAVTVTGEPVPISGVVQHHLVRIAQEAVTNAIKHGQAQGVAIHIAFTESAVSIAIQDDGVGFDVKSAMGRPGHFGLLGMRERAAKAGAQLEIRSSPGNGAKILITAPVEPANITALRTPRFSIQADSETSPR